VPLTDNRSIATDSKLYEFKGLLTFVEAKRPVDPNLIRDEESQLDVPYKSYQRFYLDQDTGGAIRGKGRVDLYFGEGDYAEVAAYNTKHTGKLFFLMSKK
jgi:membrane-bound lytic murein transglycosylase A